MKSIIIASDASGGGKTTFTIGLMKALKDRNLEVQGYKIGPDYIDPAFHKEVTGVASRNLDIHLMGEIGLKDSYSRGTGDIGIIEGVMGLYDGIGITEEASTYKVSKVLGNMPIILVLSPKGQSVTICAVINGLKDYRDANIKGIVLNGISEKYYNLLKNAIEKNCDVKVIGYLPKNKDITLNSRHLGLVQSTEVLNLRGKLDILGGMIKKYIDIDAILNLAETRDMDISVDNFADSYDGRMKIGVALDKSFNFYYRDNIELLEKVGKIVYFSPLEDSELPEGLDFLYIGGGYPEVFKEELENNKTMRCSIKKALNNGLRCYAECGGLMYLTNEIDGAEMVGYLDGKSEMTSKLQHFGYCNLKIDEAVFGKEISINAHEFHKSVVHLDEKKVYDVVKKQYDNTILKWNCGYLKNNTLAGYAHINFLGNIEFLKMLLNMNN